MQQGIALFKAWRGAALSSALHGVTVAALTLTLPTLFTSQPGQPGRSGVEARIPETQVLSLVLSPDAALVEDATSETRETGDERIIALDIVLASTIGFDATNPFDPPEPVIRPRTGQDADAKGPAGLEAVAAALAQALPDLVREAAAVRESLADRAAEGDARATALQGALAEAAERRDQAIEHYRAATEVGERDAAVRLGNLLAEGGSGAARIEALAVWLVAAETGDPFALAGAMALTERMTPSERATARQAAHDLAARQATWRAIVGEPAVAAVQPATPADAAAQADEPSDAALRDAVERGDVAAVEALLAAGADAGAADAEGRTALMRAAARGDEAMAIGFLRRGADVAARDRYGRTALTEAAWSGRPMLARLLIDLGADVDAATNDGASPLMWAAINGHGAVVKALIESGATVDARDSQGYTPLIRAAWNGHGDVVRILLEAGADPDAAAADGADARSRAAASGDAAVIALVRAALRLPAQGLIRRSN